MSASLVTKRTLRERPLSGRPDCFTPAQSRNVALWREAAGMDAGIIEEFAA